MRCSPTSPVIAWKSAASSSPFTNDLDRNPGGDQDEAARGM
jgi:hypothetical protein